MATTNTGVVPNRDASYTGILPNRAAAWTVYDKVYSEVTTEEYQKAHDSNKKALGVAGPTDHNKASVKQSQNAADIKTIIITCAVSNVPNYVLSKLTVDCQAMYRNQFKTRGGGKGTREQIKD